MNRRANRQEETRQSIHASIQAAVGRHRWLPVAIVVMVIIATNLATLTVTKMSGLATAAEASSQSSTVPSSTSNDGGINADNATTPTPTLYIHGYNGGSASTDSMIDYAQKHDGATKVLTATISAEGQVSLEGTWDSSVKAPIIQVVFEDNTNEDYSVTTTWMHSLITTLQQRYGITQYNIVAHSMGNLVAMYYEEQYGQDASLPKLAQMVAIAGDFDGELGVDDEANTNSLGTDGKPKYQNTDYRSLLAGHSGFPNGVDVLNIFGNLDDGTNSDGDITTVSARSLGSLLQGKAASYREIEVHGTTGQHSNLHEDEQVTADIDDFLWPQS